jgi:hypothetical protein
MSEKGYKCTLADGQKLKLSIDQRGWTITLQALNGTWKPSIHSKDPIWEDARKWESVPETLGINAEEWNNFRASVQQTESEVQMKKEAEEPKPDEIITSKAMDVLRNGDPIKFIIGSCERYVLGADTAFRKLCCCIATQDIKQSAGLHPRLSGESGMGKSLITLVFAHHLPPEIVSVGSSSNLAVFYHDEGNRVFRILDDYVPGGNETIDTIIKQTSTVYHQIYAHKTVKDMEPTTLYIGSEQTWAITAVDASQDIQVLNRQIPINVDDTEPLTIKVNKGTIERYSSGREQFFMDETVQVCREMWRILRSEGYISIKIPFGNRIDWLDNSNRRNPSIFLDLVIAHTAMNRFQREKDEEERYQATETDFKSAEDLFKDKDAEELVRRLTKKERELSEAITKHVDGITRDELAKELKVSGNRISQLIHGEKNKGGLMSKMPGLMIEDTTETARTDVTSKSIRKILYRLSGYNPILGFEKVVALREEPIVIDDNDNDDVGKDGKDAVRVKVRKSESKEIDNGEREERERERESKDSKEKGRENISFSSENEEKNKSFSQTPKNPYFPYSEEVDSEKASLPDPNLDLTLLTCNEESNQITEKRVKRKNFHLEIGPNPIKCIPIAVRFIKPCPSFVGEDLDHPGEVRSYGPYNINDIIALPKLNADIMVMKGIALESIKELKK